MLAGVALLEYVLLCYALGCISAAIASPGTSFGVLQGAWRARWKVVRVSLLLLATSLIFSKMYLGSLGGFLEALTQNAWG